MTNNSNADVESVLGNGMPPFAGITTFMRAHPTRNLENVDVAVLGIPYDSSASYRTGTRFGPREIRKVSPVIWGYHTKFGVTPLKEMHVIDYGDLSIVQTDAVENLMKIETGLRPLVEAAVIPLVLGGDHSISFPILRELYKRHGLISVIHFDSHMDTWDSTDGQRYTHATPFRRAIEEGLINVSEYVQIGIRGPEESPSDVQDALDLGVRIIPIERVMDEGTAAIIAEVRARIPSESPVYITLDIDVADPAYAPGTGTPEVGGLTSYQLLQLMRGLRGLNLIGFDVVEVNPLYDHADITSLLAANLAFEFLSLVADRRKRA